jgi:hypothetical protein
MANYAGELVACAHNDCRVLRVHGGSLSLDLNVHPMRPTGHTSADVTETCRAQSNRCHSPAVPTRCTPWHWTDDYSYCTLLARPREST